MLAKVKLLPIILLAAFLGLQGCGGGGGGDTSPETPPANSTDSGTTDGSTDGSTGGTTDGSTDGVVAVEKSPAEILGNPEYQAISYGGYRTTSLRS